MKNIFINNYKIASIQVIYDDKYINTKVNNKKLLKTLNLLYGQDFILIDKSTEEIKNRIKSYTGIKNIEINFKGNSNLYLIKLF